MSWVFIQSSSASQSTSSASSTSAESKSSSSVTPSVSAPLSNTARRQVDLKPIKTVLSYTGVVTWSSSSAFANAIVMNPYNSSEWGSFQLLYDEYKVDKIDVLMNLAGPIDLGPSYSNVVLAYDSGYVSTPLTFDATCNYRNSKIPEICTCRPYAKYEIKCDDPINLASPYEKLIGWQQCGIASGIGYGTLLTGSSATLPSTQGVPIRLRFHVTFRQRR